MHIELFDAGWYRPLPHERHAFIPSRLYVPGAQRPEHVGMVAPLVLLNVPPRQIVQSSNLVAPSFSPHRPSGHRSHSDELVNPVEPLYVPVGHSRHVALTVVLADSAVACFPAAQEERLQLTMPD